MRLLQTNAEAEQLSQQFGFKVRGPSLFGGHLLLGSPTCNPPDRDDLFEDVGEHELTGVPDPRHLYAVTSEK